MGAGWAPLVLFTAFFGVIGGVLPKFVPANWGQNRVVAQLCLMLVSICCWLFWLCCYMSQMNPLIGPILNQRTLIAVQAQWGKHDDW